MKALLFGAGGQVGRALIAATPATVELVTFNRAQCDIGVSQQVAAALDRSGAELVINAAAYTAVDRAEQEAATAHRLNGEAPGWIAEAARNIGARTIHISTDFVFDGNSGYPLAPDHPVSPLSVYGMSKLAGEGAVLAADPQNLIVRTAWVYARVGANFVNTMLRLLAERDLIGVVSDQVGTPTYALSLAEAVWALAAKGTGGIHHYTDAGVASWYDFAIAIAEEAKELSLITNPALVAPIRTADYPTPARRPSYSVLDKSATWTVLGAPAPHWRANLRTCLKEIKSNG